MTRAERFQKCLTLPAWCPACGRKDLKADSEKSLRCGNCGFLYFHNVAVTSSAIIECGHTFLMVRRAHDPHKGKLDFPGGFIETGERAEQALLRELAEELDYEAETDPLYLCNFTNVYEYGGVHYHTLDLYFLISGQTRPEIRVDDDVSGYEWITRNAVPEDEIGFASVRNASRYYRRWRSD